MARKKMQTPNKITLDIIKLNDMLKSFESKNDIADFVVKAVDDLVNGCKSDNVDERVMAVFKENLTSMRIRQNRSERYNQKRKLAEGSASSIATADGDTRKDSHDEKSGTSANLYGDAVNRDVAEDCLHPINGAIAHPTTVSNHFEARQSQNAMEDADISDDSVNVRHAPSGQKRCGKLESGTSSIAKFNNQETIETSTNTKSNTHAGTSPVRVDCETESSHSENVPACGACKQRYGAHKHVLLTVEEGTKLREMFGKDLRAAIEILDDYIHSLPSKKAKDLKNGAKWWREQYEAKDHYLCMTRWVRKTLNEMQTSELNRMTAENRFSRSKTAPMSFAQMERERTARALRGESIDGKDYVRDEDLTTEEFEAKYG